MPNIEFINIANSESAEKRNMTTTTTNIIPIIIRIFIILKYIESFKFNIIIDKIIEKLIDGLISYLQNITKNFPGQSLFINF